MNVIKSLIILTLILPNFAHAVSKGNKFFQTAIDTQDTTLTPLEKKIAHNFNKLYKLAQNSIVNQRLLKNLEKDIQKSNTFFDYKIWPNALIKINNLKHTKTAQSTCENLKKIKSTLPVRDYLKRNITTLCAKKYLNLLAQNSNFKLSYHKENLNYFQNNLEDFFRYQSQEDLKFLLSRFNPASDKHQLYTAVITDHITKNNIIPSKDLIRYLHITPELTKYIQGIELEQSATKNVFWKEFYKLTEDIRELSDNDAKEKDLKVKVTQAINYFNTTLPYQPRQKAFTSLLSLGKSMMRRGHFKLARVCYLRLLQEKDIEFNKVFFEHAWTYILQKDHDDVLDLAKKYIKSNDDIKDNSKLSFWLGYSHLKEGNEKIAKEIFEMTIKENPLSYYAILSAKLLAGESPKDTEEVYFKVLAETKTDKKVMRPIALDTRWVKRITAWSYVGNSRFLDKEFEEIAIRKEGFSLETHILTAAYKLSENKDYLESFKMIYRSVDQGNISITKDTLQILFPRPYLSQIKKKAKNFDPIIALSLIRQESGFNRYAKSHVGARGLMQLMPGTAKRIKRWVREKHLYNPKLNIDIGTKFFDKLMSRYDNNLVYSLAAYNAGMRRIDDWQERNYVNNEVSMLNNIENIPFLETRKYVKLIFRNIFFYKMLVGKSELEDPSHFNKIYDIHVGFNR